MSNIVSSNINELFPIQGQDNESQGFRNNFLYIKQGLATAKVELTDLQNNSAKKNADNNFDGHKLENVIVNQVSEFFRNKGNVSGVGVTANVIEAQVQKLRFTSNSTLRLTGWPSIGSIGKSYRIRLHLCSNSVDNYTIIFATDGQGTIKYAGDGAPFPSPFVVSISGAEKVIDAWSYDGGVTVFIKYLGEFV
jgi:hypothetical protein